MYIGGYFDKIRCWGLHTGSYSKPYLYDGCKSGPRANVNDLNVEVRADNAGVPDNTDTDFAAVRLHGANGEGRLSFLLTAAKDLALSRFNPRQLYHFDIKIKLSDDTLKTPELGRLRIIPGVTEASS